MWDHEAIPWALRVTKGPRWWGWALLCPALATRNGSKHRKSLELFLTARHCLVRFLNSHSAQKDYVVEMPLTDLLFLRASSINICSLWSLRGFVYFLIDGTISANWAIRTDWISSKMCSPIIAFLQSEASWNSENGTSSHSFALLKT